MLFGIFGGGGRNFCTSSNPQFDLEKVFQPIFEVLCMKKVEILFFEMCLMCAYDAVLADISSEGVVYVKEPKKKQKLDTQNFSGFYKQK